MSKVAKNIGHLPFPGVAKQTAMATRWACQMIGRQGYYANANKQQAQFEAKVKAVQAIEEAAS